MLIKDADLQEVLTTAGFIVEGMMAYRLHEVSDKHGEGCIGLVTEATSYAPYIERLYQIGRGYMNHHQDKSASGVWPYDVVSEFGSWFALSILNECEAPDETRVRNVLVDMVHGYCLKDNDFTEEQQAELLKQLKQST